MVGKNRIILVAALLVMGLGRLLPDVYLSHWDRLIGRPGDTALVGVFTLLVGLLWSMRRRSDPRVGLIHLKPRSFEPVEAMLASHLRLEQAIDHKLQEVVDDTERSALSIIQEVRDLYDTSHKLVAYLDSSGLRGSTMEAEISDCVSFLVELGSFVHDLPDKMRRDMSSVQLVVKEITDLSALVGSVQAISMQSHLLAINAAIEGSHAGPSGAAFRVVAHEMRKLATHSSEVSTQIKEGLMRAQHVVVNSMAASLSESAQQLESVSQADASIQKLNENVEDMRQFYKIRVAVVTKYNEDLLREIAEVLGHIQYQDVVSQCIDRIRLATAQRNAFFQSAVGVAAQADGDLVNLPSQLDEIVARFLNEEDKHRHSARHEPQTGGELKIELF